MINHSTFLFHHNPEKVEKALVDLQSRCFSLYLASHPPVTSRQRPSHGTDSNEVVKVQLTVEKLRLVPDGNVARRNRLTREGDHHNGTNEPVVR